MRILYLFNKVRTGTEDFQNIEKGRAHDSHLFGMLRLRKRGVVAEYLEPEQFYPRWFMKFVRTHILNIFWVHILLLPKIWKYDIVFTSTAYGPLLLWAVYPWKKPKWVVLDFNILGTIGEGKSIRQKIFKLAVSRASGIITINEKERDDLRALFPHNASNIEFIHEATDVEYFAPRGGISEEGFVLTVGKDPGRDFETLIAATEKVGVPLVIATKPEFLKHLNPLPPHVTIRHMSHEEMVRTYAMAAVVAISLKSKKTLANDSMGTFSLIEAMAMGKAVAVSDTPSMRSYLEHDMNGMLVPFGEEGAWERILKDLLNNPGKRKILGTRAREFVVTHANAELFADKLHAYFSRLIKAPK
jgi:glycosyltransferase involved in cell wall biosynthesis